MNYKIQVTPAQSKKIQQICFDEIYWNYGHHTKISAQAFIKKYSKKRKEKSMKNKRKYKVGDILLHGYGYENKILGICDLVYHLSKDNNFDIADENHWTEQELDKEFTLKLNVKKEGEKHELTRQEIAEKFGIDVKKLVIKHK